MHLLLRHPWLRHSTTAPVAIALSSTAPLATPTHSHMAPLTAPSPLPITQGSTSYFVAPELSKNMKPPRLEILPNAPDAIRIFKHGMFIFKGLVGSSAQNKLVLLLIACHTKYLSYCKDALHTKPHLPNLRAHTLSLGARLFHDLIFKI